MDSNVVLGLGAGCLYAVKVTNCKNVGFHYVSYVCFGHEMEEFGRVAWLGSHSIKHVASVLCVVGWTNEFKVCSLCHAHGTFRQHGLLLTQ
jgi:hypothetical protein